MVNWCSTETVHLYLSVSITEVNKLTAVGFPEDTYRFHTHTHTDTYRFHTTVATRTIQHTGGVRMASNLVLRGRPELSTQASGWRTGPNSIDY